MYKNQLQELAQRSCFNLPSYACIREGPDHAPRFRASVNFNGEIFEAPSYCTTLRQAEHAAAEVALLTLSTRGPSRSLTARVLDETGVYKNLLQETAHRAGLNLPVYTTVRSGPGHVPVFTCSVELAGMNFSGEPAKTKKQAEKNAALAAWSTLKQMPSLGSSSSQTNKETESNQEQEQEQEQVVVARVLSKFSPKDDTKHGKQRNLNQARRRMVPGYRDRDRDSNRNGLLLYPPQWRSMSLLSSDFYPVVPNHQQILGSLHSTMVRRPNSPREKENPSLYTSNKPIIPVQVRSLSQVMTQEIPVPVPVDEHQKDEEEWLGKPFVIEKKCNEKDTSKEGNSSSSNGLLRPKPPTYQMPQFPVLIKNQMSDQNTTTTTQQQQQSHIRNQAYRPPPHPHPSIAPAYATRCGFPHTAFSFPRDINTVGFYPPHNMAPAVHIRSVIPVCTAPPSNVPKPSQVKEASPPPPVSANVSIHTEQEAVPAAAAAAAAAAARLIKMNNLQL